MIESLALPLLRANSKSRCRYNRTVNLLFGWNRGVRQEYYAQTYRIFCDDRELRFFAEKRGKSKTRIFCFSKDVSFSGDRDRARWISAAKRSAINSNEVQCSYWNQYLAGYFRFYDRILHLKNCQIRRFPAERSFQGDNGSKFGTRILFFRNITLMFWEHNVLLCSNRGWNTEKKVDNALPRHESASRLTDPCRDRSHSLTVAMFKTRNSRYLAWMLKSWLTIRTYHIVP